MNQKQVRIVSALMATASAILAFGDKVKEIPGLPGWLVAAWPFFLLLATIFDRVGHILVEPAAPVIPTTGKTGGPGSLLLLAFAGSLAGLLAGCADKIYYPNGQIAGVFMSDRVNEKMTGGGMTYSVGSASHSSVAKAHWHGIIAVGGEVGTTLLGLNAVQPAARAAATIVPALPAVVNRPTSRATPTPTPVPAPVVLSAH